MNCVLGNLGLRSKNAGISFFLVVMELTLRD